MSATTGTTKPNVAGLVLAAGMSRRAGNRNKLLCKHAGTPLVQHVVQALADSQAKSSLVVVGHEAEAVEQAVARSAVAVSVNMDFKQGLSSSLVHGVSLLYETDAVIVCLGDMPHVTTDVINLLIAAMIKTPEKSMFIPIFQGQRGNPVLITKAKYDDILTLTGDQGARVLAQQQPESVVEISTSSEGVLIDYDTVDELDSLSGLHLV